MREISNTVTVRIRGKNFERFVNECGKEGITLTAISYNADGPHCAMKFSDFRKIRPVAKRSGVSLKIVKKDGMGFFLRLHRRRYGFFAGAILTLAIMIYLTSCIWVIDIVGNDTTKSEEIRSVLKESGIYIGALRFGHDLSDIKNEALIKLDTLSWLWVSLDGTRAYVEVREKGDALTIVDKSKPYNLVASWPGVIYDMQVKSGRKTVVRGDTVQKGDLLVSGITQTAYGGNRYITSSGTVTARTWRSMEGEYHHTQTNKIRTGNLHRRFKVNFFGKTFKLYLKEKCKFDNFQSEKKTENIKIFKNIYLPITFTTEVFYEIILEDETIPDSIVISEAVESLTEKIKTQRAEGAVTLKRTYSYEKLPGGNLSISVTIESLENIAHPVEIEVTDAEDSTFGENN